MNQPPWMAFAWRELGQKEMAGASASPRIADYFRRAGHAQVRDDETPWCAAFVGACLDAAEIAGTNSLAARSYLDWGVAAEEPEYGAVTVLSRGSDPALGHVGFLVGLTDSQVILLGGNQSNAVTVAAFARDRVLGLRRPAAVTATASVGTGAASASASPTAPSPFDDIFARALAHVLEFEGGWSDDPFDPGGPTNKGITLADFAREIGITVAANTVGDLKARLAVLPDAEVERIYRERYWTPACCNDLPAALAFFHFDAAVNQGVGRTARMLQQALGVGIDGEIGPETLAAAASDDVSAVLVRYAEIRRRHYRSLSHFWRFGRGWLRRVDTALSRAQALARQAPNSSLSPTATKESPMAETPAASPAASTSDPASTESKWWGHSLTIWGTIITAVSTVAPALLANLGVDLPGTLIQALGHDLLTFFQAAAGLGGTIMTIVGRFRASAPLERRALKMKV
jgi:uncharacterized protein (TIGR02594 family)